MTSSPDSRPERFGQRSHGGLANFPPVADWDDVVLNDAKAHPRRVEKHYTLVPTTCFNCESACGLLAYVDRDDLSVRKVEGNPAHPGSRGRNCAKGPATINQINDPERILTPLRRVGERGSGRFEPVSWDVALDDLAGRIRAAIVEDRRDEVIYHAEENLGVAVDTERGLLVPVIRGAGDLNIAGLAKKIADLADRTRANRVTPDELGGGTFTLTNTGSRGALFDTPIINQPQVGILGTGAVVKRAVVVPDADGGESIAIRQMVYLALSYDHRLVDGADAARFLVAMKTRLEDGSFDGELGA